MEPSPKFLLLDKRVQARLKDYMPPDNMLEGLAGFFSILSDKTRLRIISALAISPMCVGDISLSLGINQTTVSHQLRTLKSLGAVNYRRQGKIIFYELANQQINEVMLNGVEYLGY